MIKNISPVVYWELGDYVRNGGSPTSVQDASYLLFTNAPQRAAIPVNSAASNVQAGWTSGAASDSGSYNFVPASANCFYLPNTAVGFSDYSDIFTTNSFLIWARVRVNSVAGTSEFDSNLFSIRGKTGSQDQLLALDYANKNTSEQRIKLNINNGNSIQSIPCVIGDIDSTTEFFDVAFFVDLRSSQGTAYSFFNGTLKNSPTISRGQLVIGTANANHAICIGCDKPGAGVSSLLDGELLRVGIMNFNNKPPDDISGLVKALHLGESVPSDFMGGI